MGDNQSYGNHVWMFEDMESRPSGTWDTTLGVLNAITGVVGVVGNSLAFGYFLGKLDLPSKLYCYICCINIILGFSQVPVICALLNERKPGVFSDKLFCSIWMPIRQSFGGLYSLAVLLLSTSRTIAIIYPFYHIKKHLVIGVLYVFVLLLGLQEIGKYSVGISTVYGTDGPYCYNFFDASEDGFTVLQSRFASAKLVFDSVGLASPVISSVVSLILIPRKLLSKPKTLSVRGEQQQQQQQQQRQRKATTTVVVFTGAFLLFYMPYFSLTVLHTVANMSIFEPEAGIFSVPFMFWYSWPLCEFCNTLNSSIDFMVYLTRMKSFRVWLILKGQKVARLIGIYVD